mmetsp:Transcript_54566/g.127576  ORF Transcript_54566/g.127576 Transcript_54566/m.127576 type:complete len:86 (-) Transcript_54566:526-783(-)
MVRMGGRSSVLFIATPDCTPTSRTTSVAISNVIEEHRSQIQSQWNHCGARFIVKRTTSTRGTSDVSTATARRRRATGLRSVRLRL